jgi:hypothetical protein
MNEPDHEPRLPCPCRTARCLRVIESGQFLPAPSSILPYVIPAQYEAEPVGISTQDRHHPLERLIWGRPKLRNRNFRRNPMRAGRNPPAAFLRALVGMLK